MQLSLTTRRLAKCYPLPLRHLCNITQVKQPKLTKVNGEWLCDSYPDISLLTQSNRLTESLVKRATCQSLSEAEQLIDSVKETFHLYKISRDQFTTVNDNFDQHDSKEISAKCDRKMVLRSARNERQRAHGKFIELYHSIPNVVDDIAISSSAGHFKADWENISIPVLAERIDPIHCLPYLSGKAALLELELTSCTAEFLEKQKFVPITVPCMLRCELLEQAAVTSCGPSSIYTLLTKSELHDSSTNRKAKSEDNFVYNFQGLSELSFMAFLLRRNCETLPVRLYSVGNKYWISNNGQLAQSRIALFLTGSSSKEQAIKEYILGVELIENFWQTLGVSVVKQMVKPYMLAKHEACAVEFVLERDGMATQVTLSRMSVSYDYVSRRIMTYSAFTAKDYPANAHNQFCHFATGHLIDVNNLLSSL